MYEKILDSFREDMVALDVPADFSDKQNELENKFKKEEQKKVEKLLRKDLNEWDDMWNGGPGLRTNAKGLKTLGDKINKIMKDSVSKAMKKHTMATGLREQQLQSRD